VEKMLARFRFRTEDDQIILVATLEVIDFPSIAKHIM